MTERPIPMSAPMVRAILSGSKSQTRRVVKPQPTHFNPAGTPRRVVPEGGPSDVIRCPYGQPGDRLWVREAWRAMAEHNTCRPLDIPWRAPIVYEASRHPDTAFGKLRPGMFMPRWASRITLEVTGVRVERLQDISEADAVSEGIERSGECNWRDYRDHPYNDFTNARRSYRSLWEQINGPGSWDANPWAWAVEFRRIESEAAHSRRVA